jgi:hypothetical protein
MPSGYAPPFYAVDLFHHWNLDAEQLISSRDHKPLFLRTAQARSISGSGSARPAHASSRVRHGGVKAYASRNRQNIMRGPICYFHGGLPLLRRIPGDSQAIVIDRYSGRKSWFQY